MNTNSVALYMLLVMLTGITANSGEISPGEWNMYGRDKRRTAFQPMKGAIRDPEVVWEYSLLGSEGYVIFQPGGDKSSIKVDSRKHLNAHYFSDETQRLWGLGYPLYDMAGDGKLIEVSRYVSSKVGKLIPGTKGLQRVQLKHRGYNIKPNQVDMRIYSYEDGSEKEVFHKVIQDGSERPYPILGDMTGDGDLNIIQSDYGLMMLYNGSGELMDKLTWWVRHRGQVYAEDIDGDGKVEVLTISAVQAMASMTGFENGKLENYWVHGYEPDVRRNNYVIHPIRNSLVDLDRDGKFEVVYNLFDQSSPQANRKWTVTILDAKTGESLLELPGYFVQDIRELDDSGVKYLFMVKTDAMGIPAYGELKIARFADGKLIDVWDGKGKLHRVKSEVYKSNHSSESPVMDMVMGDVDGNGKPEFFVSQRLENGVEHCKALGLDDKGGIAPVLDLEWDSAKHIRVMAVADANGDGKNEVLIHFAGEAGVYDFSASSGTFECVSVRKRQTYFDTNGSAVVADLSGEGKPSILVHSEGDKIDILQIDPSTKKPHLLKRLPGTAMSLVYRQQNYGTLVADLNNDGKKYVLSIVTGPNGHAAVQAMDVDGKTLWTTEFPNSQIAEMSGREYNHLAQLAVGHFRNEQPLDVVVGGTFWTALVSGSNGELLWMVKEFEGSRRIGGWSPYITADLDQDGFDEIVMLCGMRYGVFDRHGKVLVYSMQLCDIMPVWTDTRGGIIVLLDSDGDSKYEVFGTGHSDASWRMEPMASSNNSLVWYQPHVESVYSIAEQKIAGIADVNGDGKLEMISYHAIEGEINSTNYVLQCQDLATGEVLWTEKNFFPSEVAYAGDMVSCDINGDGITEVIFTGGNRLYALNGVGGKANVIWSITLPAKADFPVVADVDGDGASEILVSCSDGYLRCIDGE